MNANLFRILRNLFSPKPPNISVFSAFFRKFVSARIREDELWGSEQQAKKASQMRRREIGFFHRQFPINPRLVKEFKSFSSFPSLPLYTPRRRHISIRRNFLPPNVLPPPLPKVEIQKFPSYCLSKFVGKLGEKKYRLFPSCKKYPAMVLFSVSETDQ